MSVYFAQHLLNMKTGCNSLIVTKLGLWHLCVPHLAQCSFLPNNQTLQNGFLISVTHSTVSPKIGRHFKVHLFLKQCLRELHFMKKRSFHQTIQS